MSGQTGRSKKHHLIAKCLQNGWADASGLVAVVSKRERGWRRVPPKTQFRVKNLMAYKDDRGQWQSDPEDRLSEVENDAIIHVRRLNNGADDQQARSSAADMCALHYARSLALKMVVRRSATDVLVDYEDGTVEHREVFRKSRGRDPLPGEMQALAARLLDAQLEANIPYVNAVFRLFKSFRQNLNGAYIQIVTIVPGPVTFAMADSPVVLSAHGSRSVGSAAQPVALAEAAEIWFPVGPRAGISFSRVALNDQTLTPSEAHALNTRSWTWAAERLLCSPADGPHNCFGWPARRLPEIRTDAFPGHAQR